MTLFANNQPEFIGRLRDDKTRRNQLGTVLPLVAISTVTIFVMAGFVLDIGLAYKDRKDSQLAADAAALAGAHELFRGNSGALATWAAYSAAADNGYANGVDGASITVNTPPASGFYVGNNMSVEVTISRPTPTGFLRVINVNNVGVTTRAVANGNLAASLNCIYALDPNQEGAFEVTSTSEFNAGCGIQVNSNNYRASKVESGACVKAGMVGITGDYTHAQVCGYGGDAYECSLADTCPTTGVPPAPDPLASYPTPTVDYSNCDFTGKEKVPGGPYERYLVDGGTVTLNPGTYCGGLDIKGDALVTFNPGTYVLRGGGLFVSGGDTHIEGNGVTFYNTCFNPCVGNESDQELFSPIEITSSSSANLAAPTSGPMEAMLFFQDRNGPTSPDPGSFPSNRIDSSVDVTLSGIMYFLTQHFKYHSSAAGQTGDYMVIVAKTFEVSSNSKVYVNNNYGGLNNGAPLKRVTLVE